MGTDRTTRVEFAAQEGVATVTISDPERRNPVGTETAGLLAETLRRAAADPAVRVVVVTGAGSAFSSGGDLKEFLATTSADASEHWASGEPWCDLYRTLGHLCKPTIAQVRGPALAGGCGIVAACDFAVASDNAVFGTPEAKIGLFPLFILPALIRATGRRNALAMALTARTMDAAEAERIGLVTRVVADDRLEDEVAALAAQLAGIGPLTMKMGKRAFNRIAELEFDEGLEAARDLRVPFMGSPELKAGISRFLDKPR